jgi:hypothetical protein
MSDLKNTLSYCIQENVFGKTLVVKYVNLFAALNTEEFYNLAVVSLNASKNLCDEFIKDVNLSSRILATLSDGTVWYDSSKGDKNTFENYKLKVINENHESRYSIRQAMDSYEGFGWESKFSSTTQNFENYYAVRGGQTPNQISYVIRLSFS